MLAEIKEFGKDQQQQDDHGLHDLACCGSAARAARGARPCAPGRDACTSVPHSTARQMPSSASAGIPGDAALAIAGDDQGGGQRAQRLAGIAADLEQRLRQTVPAARGHARDPAGFGMKHRRTAARSACAETDHHADSCRPATAPASPNRVATMPQGSDQGIGRLSAANADGRLQQRSGCLERQGDKSDLGEIQMQRAFRVG